MTLLVQNQHKTLTNLQILTVTDLKYKQRREKKNYHVKITTLTFWH